MGRLAFFRAVGFNVAHMCVCVWGGAGALGLNLISRGVSAVCVSSEACRGLVRMAVLFVLADTRVLGAGDRFQGGYPI